MKTVHLKLFFPSHWNQTEPLAIYHNQELIAHLQSNQFTVVQLPQEATSLHWQRNEDQNSIVLPPEETTYLLLSASPVGDGLFSFYRKTKQSKSIQGTFVSQAEFENSTKDTLYQKKQTWLPSTKLDKPILYIGLLIGIISLLYAIYAQTNWSAILFLLGGGTIVSLLILIFEKNRVPMSDYKSRMWASVGCFILIILMIPRNDYAIQILLMVLTLGFILRFLYHIRKLQIK